MKQVKSIEGRIVSINLSEEKGTEKHPTPSAQVSFSGIEGDAHAGDWHRQISLLALEDIRRFEQSAGESFSPGVFAENLTVSGIPLDQVAILDRFRCGNLCLEVTQIGKRCHGDGCSVYRQVGRCVMPQSGIFCRVISEGRLETDSPLIWEPRPLRIRIVTLSDRAAQGIYEDRSGPAIRTRLDQFFEGKRWHPAMSASLQSDDYDPLVAQLNQAVQDGVDLVFTTGGTGLGPRDHAPEAVLAVAEKTIPGIMEQIRCKYGQDKPNALLSRSVAGYKAKTLFYTLPGSERAVGEYMEEILKSLEHALLMLHSIGH